jgi:ketosteroid isomerase-like protein
MDSSSDGNAKSWITVSEHSHAWAYNRCPCTDCVEGYPAYPPVPDYHQCGNGAHTLVRGGAYGSGNALSTISRTVQSSWDNHFAAFGGQDLDKIMLDYTEASVLESYEFPAGTLTTATGLVQIRKFFADLFHLLHDTSGLTAPVLQVTSSPAQVYLAWTAPTSEVKSAADSFFFAHDNTILRQNIVWTRGSVPHTYDAPTTVHQSPAQMVIGDTLSYHATTVQQAWDNHFAAFGAQSVEQVMLDYIEESQLRAFDHRTGVMTEANGRAQIQQFFADLFIALHDTSGLTAPIVHVTDSPASKQVYLVWTCPTSGILTATDSFLFGNNNKILRQNIVYTSIA